MKKKVLAALMVMGTTAALGQAVPVTHAAPGDKAQKLVCDNTKDDPYTGTYASVRVPKGASCYLQDATVEGNVMANHGAVDVWIVDTAVERNIKIRGAERDVKIGSEDCKVDPVAGNNIMVTRSHNVAICWMTVDNNIMVTRNDGRMMLRDNTVGNSIRVTKNLPYAPQPGDGDHVDIDAIRVYRNTAERHIVLRDNSDRPLILKENTPEPRT
jgi:hypothetical protein